MSAEDGDDGIEILKEGILKKQVGKKYEDRWFILTSGSLFYYKSAKELEAAGSMHLKNAEVLEDVDGAKEKEAAFQVKVGDRVLVLRAKDASRKKEWIADLRAQLGNEKTEAPNRTVAKKKRNLGRSLKEKAATSSMGKKILTKLLPKEVFELLKHFLLFNTTVADKARAKEIDADILKICTKMALLYDEKKISGKAFGPLILPTLMLWSSFTDMCDMEFARDPPMLIAYIKDMQQRLSTLLKQHMQPKTVQRLDDIFALLCNEETIAKLFSDEPEIVKFREASVKILGTLWNAKVSDRLQRAVLKLQTQDYKPGDDVPEHVMSAGSG
jgi:PH domain/Domain of unknown function (DUF758)